MKKATFGYYIENMCIKSSRKLQALTRIAPYMDLSNRKYLMNTFSNSQFSYCLLVWMCHSRALNNKMNKLHECYLRLIYNDKQLTFEEFLLFILSQCILEICKLSPMRCARSWMVVLLKLWRKFSEFVKKTNIIWDTKVHSSNILK